MENFTITVLNSTGGARLGNKLTANLQINKNDDPIYFSGKYTALNVKGFPERVKKHMNILYLQSFTPMSHPVLRTCGHAASGRCRGKLQCSTGGACRFCW